MLAYMGPDGGRAGGTDRAEEMGRRPAPAPSLKKTERLVRRRPPVTTQLWWQPTQFWWRRQFACCRTAVR